MNRFVKGSIAGIVGIALLLGGASTFAYWNSTASVSAGTVTAGNLAIAANSDGVWKDGSTTIDPTTYKIIPGKTLVYTQSLAVTATGNGLSAGLTVSGLTATGSLSTLITPTLAVTSSSSNVTIAGSTITVVSAATNATVLATVTVAFPSGATTGQLGTLNLSALTFTLTQTP